MTQPSGPDIAIYYDTDAYEESHVLGGAASGPAGLMGRQVAGKEFLDAYLTHGTWGSLTAIVQNRERANPLVRLCRDHPSSRNRPRRLRIIPEADLLSAFPGSEPAANVIHYPSPPDARFAWARQGSGGRFALCGVTHTLSSLAAVRALCELVAAPFETFDALVCTSRAVCDMVRTVTGSYAEYLSDRFGGTARLRPRLETIPLGVNTRQFRPATQEERALARERLEATEDELLVLCVGRLSHHAKAHPYPVFHAVNEAARRTAQRVHLVFAGWAARPETDRAYRDGAARLAPAARVTFVDGVNPENRRQVWHAADLLIALPDNIQETFGLVVVEAMASGLPVIGSDWNGYRDLIVDGETGLLAPTRMLRGATVDSTMRLLTSHAGYDMFLAECCQTVTVDLDAAAASLIRLAADANLRRRMGQAGHERAVQHFDWQQVIRRYEALWTTQRLEARGCEPANRSTCRPAMYPPPEESFVGYPTRWLDDVALVQATRGARDRLVLLLHLPLTNLAADRRCHDPATLDGLLGSLDRSRSIGELAAELERSGCSRSMARATLAWLMKYGLINVVHVMGTGEERC